MGPGVGDAVGSGVAVTLGAELLTDELFAAAFTAVRAMPAPVPTTRIMAQLEGQHRLVKGHAAPELPGEWREISFLLML